MARDLTVNLFTPTAQGLVPSPGQSTGLFLRDDGKWGAASLTVGGVPISSLQGTANQIAVTASAGVATLSLAPNVVLPAPPSGSTLSVTGVAGSTTTAPITTTNGGLFASDSAGTTNALTMNSVGADFGQIFNVGTQAWALGYGTTVNTPGTVGLLWTPAPLVQVRGGGTFTSSIYAGAGRATLQLNGSADAVLDFSTTAVNGGAYLFFSGSEFRLNNVSGGPVTFWNANVQRFSVQNGLFANGLTDEGLGTVNATGYFLNNAALALPASVRETSIETRTSTTTLTNSQLTLAIAAAGVYAVEIVFGYSTAGTAGIGCAVGVNYSGTFTAASSTVYLSGANGSGAGSTITAAVNSALASPTTAGTTAAPQYFIIRGTLTATGAGTLSLAFAQSSSSATATSSIVGSYMLVTKIG